jgi:hypothetical protein
VTHSRPCSYEYFWPLFIYESSPFIPCHAWFVLFGFAPFFWMMRLLADPEGQPNATLCENSGILYTRRLAFTRLSITDLVTTSFGSFVAGRTIPRQASMHQAKHHLSGQVQKVRPGFSSAAALASLARSHPGEGLNG